LQTFYAEEAVFFENRVLVLAGRQAALVRERQQLMRLANPPTLKVLAWAADDERGEAFLEVLLRFEDAEGRTHRLEQILSQRWERGLVQQERAVFEGLVDEGDDPTCSAMDDPSARIF
jgi:hypothetical protein